MPRSSRSRGGEESTAGGSRSTRDSGGPIDPNMPDWWNERKKSEMRAKSDARKAEMRKENERKKIAAGNVVSYRDLDNRGGGRAQDMTDSERAKYIRKSAAGAVAVYGDEKDSARKKGGNPSGNIDINMDYGDRIDDRVGKKVTADEELQGRSLLDLVDRGTLMVGVCLILIVIIAITIPVALISEDEPYVAPPVPDPPTLSPTSARYPDYFYIFDRVKNIVPGGEATLRDESTAHYRALNWLVYEDGMELGHSKDHLHQRFVLMVIYFISGPWTPVEGRLEWGSPVHECEWEGIFCKDIEDLEEELNGRIDELLEVGREDGIKIDVPQRIVNRLELRQRLVSGEVPGEFSLLYYLQHLDLENNQLVGGLPTPLYKLFNLQTLFLEQNSLTNVDNLGEYRHLEHLALSKNSFQGPLPESFKNLKKLRTLYLHTNSFTGEVFDIIKDFKSMELLDIAFNEFEGTFPSELGAMQNLTSFFAGHNQFNGEIPIEIEQCKKLKQFQVDGSHDVGGPIPTVFGSLASLEFLKLDTCAFSGELPTELGNLKNLTFLDVNSNDLSGNIPTEYGGMSSIVTFALANNDISGEVPSELGQLLKMETMKIQNTDLSGVMPDEICALRYRNDTVLGVLEVPNNVECSDTCCTLIS